MPDLILAVDSLPVLNLSLSSLAIDSSPAPFLSSGCAYPGTNYFLVVSAAALPNTTKSNSEFAPSLFAPCTDAQAASPAARSPVTFLSLPYSSNVRT